MADADGLTAFFAARLDELEAAALAAAAATPTPWVATGEDVVSASDDPYWRGACAANASGAEAAHIALNDPGAVLADVAAKRAILAEYEAAVVEMERQIAVKAAEIPAGFAGDAYLLASERIITESTTLRSVVMHLAAAWNGHKDYRQEWKP